MSPKQKTKFRRANKNHPNRANQRKNLKRVKENIRILQQLAQDDTTSAEAEDASE